MPRTRLVQYVALGACALLVWAASLRMPSVNAGRRDLNMMGSADPLQSAPPEYAFAIQAFGAFRGLITDIAFIRAEKFKEEGRYYDAMQLAKWICTLQPHFPAVWEFASWNMAWNISVTTYTAEERWNWVYNGVKLLRDQGIPYNPRSVNLYKQLAWTFNNKMSETTDDYNYAYKCNWAWRMHLVLGPPPQPLADLAPDALAAEAKPESEPDLLAQAGREAFAQSEEKLRREAEARGETYKPRSLDQAAAAAGTLETSSFEISQKAGIDYLKSIAAAPEHLADLYAQHPETRTLVTALREQGVVINDDTLTEDEYWREGGLAFTFFAPYRELGQPVSLLARIATEQRPEAQRVQARVEHLDKVLGVRAGSRASEPLVRWLQRKVLTEVYKLEPEYMIQVVENFGPVDWRVVDAHSLYWVTKGLVMGGETVNNFRNDKTNTARILFFSLRNLFLRNRITFEPNPDKIELSYLNFNRDLNFIEPMHQAYVRYGPLFDPRPDASGGAGGTYRVGHINFLTEAIRLLYISGHEKEAGHYYDYMQRVYPMAETGERNMALAKSLHDFVMESFVESIGNEAGVREVRLAVDGLLTNAYSELATGNVTRYARLVQRAREIHVDYQRTRLDTGSERLRLPPFLDMQTDALVSWLAPPAITSWQTIHKVRLWAVTPLYLRQDVYDVVLPTFKAECQAFHFDLAKAFPEPPGMEEYRRTHPERFKSAKPGEETETLPQTLDGG